MKLRIPKKNWDRCVHMRDVTLAGKVTELTNTNFNMSVWHGDTECGTSACAGG